MNELRRSSFEKASIGPAVGIYVILDFSICSNMHWTFSEMFYEGFWESTWTESSSFGFDFE